MNFGELETVPAHQPCNQRTNKNKMEDSSFSTPLHFQHTNTFSAHQHIFRAPRRKLERGREGGGGGEEGEGMREDLFNVLGRWCAEI